jgi:hypothetical protein
MIEMDPGALADMCRWAELAEQASQSLHTAVEWAHNNGIAEDMQDDPVCAHVQSACETLVLLVREIAAAFQIGSAGQGEGE